MAPKTFYDAGEVQKKVTETAEKTFKTLQEEGWEFSESTQLPTAIYLTRNQRYGARSVSSGLTATKAQTRALPRGFVTTIT